MRIAFAILLTIFAAPATAHVGHLGEVAGHGHWLGAAALGGAIAIGLWQGLRAKGARSQSDSDTVEAEDIETAEEEPKEA